MELIPTNIDGAIVFNLRSTCKSTSLDCETCRTLAIYLHNWMRVSGLGYIVFDFLEEKEVCYSFLEEIQIVRKRLAIPMLFAGVMEKPRRLIEQFDYGFHYPFFLIPEDAIRAMRMQHPGITESSPKLPIYLDEPFLESWRARHEDMEMVA